jgi:hypothetical protein
VAFPVDLGGGCRWRVIIAAILFFVGIGFRPDIFEAVKSDRFLFKFVVTVSLAVTAIWVTLSVGVQRLRQRHDDV